MKFICKLCGATFSRDMRIAMYKCNYTRGKGYRTICIAKRKSIWAKEAGR